MNFYSTYYKNHATNAQTKKMKEIFDSLDGGGVAAQADKALNANELANIFTNQTFNDDEKNMLLSGFDMDDDGYLTYNEFSKAFLEFDIDDSTDITMEEGVLIKTKLDELNKEQDILKQYGIINNFSSTSSQKAAAREKIDKFKAERLVINSDTKIQEKQILISRNETKAMEIQEYVESSTLLEFEKVQKLKEANTFLAENEILTLELNILKEERKVRNIDKKIIINEQKIADETDETVLEQLKINDYTLQAKKIGAESKLSAAENNMEQYQNNVQIQANQSMLTKFYIPEIYKENARKTLEDLYDQNQLLAQRNQMYNKVSKLCKEREQTAELQYQLDSIENTQENAAIRQALLDQINQAEALLVLEATLETKKTDLLNKQLQLKATLPMINHGSAFEKKAARLQTDIDALQTEIADLEAQLI